MTNTRRIDQYIDRLSRDLAAVPESERGSITDEIRMHLEARAVDGRLEEAIASLGAPEVCARAYLEELSAVEPAANAPVSAGGQNLAIKAWGRVSAISGFILMAFLYILTAAFVFSLIAELVQPSHNGMWLEAGHLHWGMTSGVKYDIDQEILGFWFVPLNILLVAVFFMLAEVVGRFSKRRVLHDW